jgi:hypothetical protein
MSVHRPGTTLDDGNEAWDFERGIGRYGPKPLPDSPSLEVRPEDI